MSKNSKINIKYLDFLELNSCLEKKVNTKSMLKTVPAKLEFPTVVKIPPEPVQLKGSRFKICRSP